MKNFKKLFTLLALISVVAFAPYAVSASGSYAAPGGAGAGMGISAAAGAGAGSAAGAGAGAYANYRGSADAGANKDTGTQRALQVSPARALYSYEGYDPYEYENYFVYDYYARYVQPTATPSPAPSGAQPVVSQPAGNTAGGAGSAGSAGSAATGGAAAAGSPAPTSPPPSTEVAATTTSALPTASPTPVAPAAGGDAPIVFEDAPPPAAAGFSGEQILERLIERIKLDMAEAIAVAETGADAVADADAEPGADTGIELIVIEPGIEDQADGEPSGEEPPESGLLVLINVTNPNVDEVEIVYKSAYSICGVRDDDADPEEPVIIFLTRYDAQTGEYAEFADIDGESQWTVGANGVFTRSVLLEEGENNFAIAACTASVIEAAQTEGRYIEDHEVQVVKFTILYRSQNVTEKISELLKELTIANILKEIDNH